VQFTSSQFLSLSLSRTSTPSLCTTNVRAKIRPIDAVLDYDLMRRCHRVFVPVSAPVSMRMGAATIVDRVNKQKKAAQDAKGDEKGDNSKPSKDGKAATSQLLVDVSIGAFALMVPIDRNITNCPILRVDLELSSIKKSIVTSVDPDNVRSERAGEQSDE